MKQEFFVWAYTARLPSISDITNALAAAGFSCRVQKHEGDGERPDPHHWHRLQLSTDAEGAAQSCLITATVPLSEEIDQLAEQYEDLPLQAKNASRKYVISAEGDEYGQATLFQLRVVAVTAELTHGVVEDPQESGLMFPDEFERFMESS